jgi:shikimate kinase
MGTGKTETAKLLTKQLKRAFIDMDDLIEAKEKMPISEIFKTKGEPYFRKVEKEVVAELAQKTGLVIACGGGAFAKQDNIELMKRTGIVICLTSSPETILRRTQRFDHRPLLHVDDPKSKIEELLKEREPFYAQAHYTIDADQLSVAQTAKKALSCLKLK